MVPPERQPDAGKGPVSQMQLEIPARSVYVGVVRLALASVARQAGLDEERVDDLRIAVSEACANAVLAEDDSPASVVRVAWREEPDRVVVEVVDDGRHTLPNPEDSLVGAERMDMSVALLRSLVDECSFEPRPEGGMTTRLTLLF